MLRKSMCSIGCSDNSISRSLQTEIISFILTRRCGSCGVTTALGDRIQIEIDESDKAHRVYMPAIPTSSKESKNVKSATTKAMV